MQWYVLATIVLDDTTDKWHCDFEQTISAQIYDVVSNLKITIPKKKKIEITPRAWRTDKFYYEKFVILDWSTDDYIAFALLRLPS